MERPQSNNSLQWLVGSAAPRRLCMPVSSCGSWSAVARCRRPRSTLAAPTPPRCMPDGHKACRVRQSSRTVSPTRVATAQRGGARVHGACHMVPPTAPCRAPQHSRRPACVLGPPRRARNAVWDAGEIICTYCGAHPRAGFDKAPPPRSRCLSIIPRAHEWPKNRKTAHESGHGCAVGDFAVGWSTLRHVRSVSVSDTHIVGSTCVQPLRWHTPHGISWLLPIPATRGHSHTHPRTAP